MPRGGPGGHAANTMDTLHTGCGQLPAELRSGGIAVQSSPIGGPASALHSKTPTASSCGQLPRVDRTEWPGIGISASDGVLNPFPSAE